MTTSTKASGEFACPAKPQQDREKLRLTVVEARREDVGRGIVRLDPETMQADRRRAGRRAGNRRPHAKPSPRRCPRSRSRGASRSSSSTASAAPTPAWRSARRPRSRKVAHAVARSLVVTPLGAGALHEDEIDHMARRLDGLAMKTGDRVRIALFGGSHRDFSVVRTEPDGPVMIHPDTLLAVESARARRAGQDRGAADDIVTYDDLGGMEREIAKIREMIELPLTHPEIFERLGMTPPKGVLMHGLPGCGKTLLARAVAHESAAAFIYVSGPEIIQKFYGESEAKLRKIFEDAQRRAPCIIFFDEIDAIAPKRETRRRRGRKARRRATARPDGRPEEPWRRHCHGRDQPAQQHRSGVAQARPFRPRNRHRHPQRIGSARDSGNLCARHAARRGCRPRRIWPSATHGFTGADLNALCREAAMAALRRQLPEWTSSSGPISYEALTRWTSAWPISGRR